MVVSVCIIRIIESVQFKRTMFCALIAFLKVAATGKLHRGEGSRKPFKGFINEIQGSSTIGMEGFQ